MMIHLLRRGWVLSLLVATTLVMPGFASETSPPARTADEWAAIATQNLKDGDRAGAIEALRAAVAIDPAHPSAGLLITTQHQSGQIEEAWAIGSRYERDGAPRNPRALFRFGWLLAFIGEVDRADTLFAKLIELDRGGIYEAWGNGERAHLARARGDARAAVAFMERAVAARPADMISRVGRAQMMIEAGNARAAIPLLEAELKADPAARAYGGTPAALILGWALRRLGDDAGAERWLAPLEKTLFPATGDAGLRQLGMEPMQTAPQLAWLNLQGRREEALALAARTPTIPLYGAPDPRDGMLATLAGEPRFEALLTRSRDQIDAERTHVVLGPLVRPGKP
jgi:Tfp pilus assembly protein PilF